MTEHGFVVPVDKPVGPTSHDVVQRARRALRVRRIGHSGTLDPFASGLLLLCVGRATRIAEFLTGLDKTYEAEAVLGVATDTEDREGAVVARSDAWRTLTEEDVREALEAFVGPVDQVPSRYSAKKVRGEAAHRRVRRGEEVELAPRRVVIHELELLAFEPPRLRFRVRCSSGTYVRALARDIGDRLEVGAHLDALRRTRIGTLAVEDALQPDELEDPRRVQEAALTPWEALAHLPRLEVEPAAARALAHGRRVPAGALSEGPLAVAGREGRLLAVGEVREGEFHPRKVFAT